MANKLIREMGLPESITNVFTARNIITAKAMLLLEQRNCNEYLAGHLLTRLKGLDAALCGGIPFGVVTELVGPAGIGKTQAIPLLEQRNLNEYLAVRLPTRT